MQLARASMGQCKAVTQSPTVTCRPCGTGVEASALAQDPPPQVPCQAHQAFLPSRSTGIGTALPGPHRTPHPPRAHPPKAYPLHTSLGSTGLLNHLAGSLVVGLQRRQTGRSVL